MNVRLALVVLMAAVTLDGWRCVDANAEEKDSQIPLTEFLRECGDKLDCHFTLEAVRVSKYENSYRCFASVWDRNQLPGTREELVDALRRGLKDTQVIVNSNNPRVIHIVEQQPTGYVRYPMTQSVTVDFDGTAPKLVLHLASKVEKLGLQDWAFIRSGEVPPKDYGTPVKVSGENLTVREVLVRAIPLKGYRRLAWTATTYHDGDNDWKTRVYLHGKVRIE